MVDLPYRNPRNPAPKRGQGAWGLGPHGQFYSTQHARKSQAVSERRSRNWLLKSVGWASLGCCVAWGLVPHARPQIVSMFDCAVPRSLRSPHLQMVPSKCGLLPAISLCVSLEASDGLHLMSLAHSVRGPPPQNSFRRVCFVWPPLWVDIPMGKPKENRLMGQGRGVPCVCRLPPRGC